MALDLAIDSGRVGEPKYDQTRIGCIPTRPINLIRIILFRSRGVDQNPTEICNLLLMKNIKKIWGTLVDLNMT